MKTEDARTAFFVLVWGSTPPPGVFSGRADDVAKVRAAARRFVATRCRNRRKHGLPLPDVTALLWERFDGVRFVELAQTDTRAAMDLLVQSAGRAGGKVK